ncbi:MAG: esterase/lipase family protein [Myxococcota bacterium]
MRPGPIRRAAATLVALAALVAGAAAQPAEPPSGDRAVHRLEVRDGGVAIADVVSVLLAEVGGPIALPGSLPDTRIPVADAIGRAAVLGLDMALDRIGVDLALRDDTLIVAIDRRQLDARIDELEGVLRRVLGRRPPVFALDRVQGSAQGGPPVVFVHGLDSGPESLHGAAAALAHDGRDVYLFRYPDDGRIRRTARALGRLLRGLHRDTGRRIDLVTVSMGGVVARTYLETDPDYGGEVARFIACCPPFGGAPLARYHAVREIPETLSDLLGEGLGGLFVFDGLGQAARDLQPDSPLMRDLRAAERREGVRYSILAGDGDVVGPEVFAVADATLARLARSEDAMARTAATWLEGLVEAARAVSGPRGDGAVTLESQRLDGVDDRAVLPVDHLSFLAGDGADEPIPGLAEVRRRLGSPGPP